MKAVIFAAGLGTRLRPITDTLPKPLVPVAGRAVLLRTLDALPASIDEVIVVVGYKSEMIREALAHDARVRFVEQPKPRGTYDALMCADCHMKQVFHMTNRFLTLNGDDLYACDDIERLADAEPFTMMTRVIGGRGRFSHIATENGRLSRIVKAADHDGETTNVYVGAALLNADFFNLAPVALPNGELSLPHTLETHAPTHPVRIMEASFWMPVGTHEELAAAEHFFGRSDTIV